MQVVNIFLGSSFRLMSVRKYIGDTIRLLNDYWIRYGIRIKLHIWEDFVIGYSGKHKQQEYIDDMVLPSDISIFMFSHRVGVFTQMELEAKLKQNKNAVFCFRLPYKGVPSQEVVEALNKIDVYAKYVIDEYATCQEVKCIVENYIRNFIVVDKSINKIEEIYFYTTIPDDLPNVQSGIGTTIRDFDDMTMDEWGIHCLLHPRKQPHLMNVTDHYIPILKNNVSDEDLSELANGISMSADKSHRIQRISVFDMGNIFNTNKAVRELLEKAGVFTEKIKDMDSLKWKLHKWLRFERKKILSSNACVFDVRNGCVNMNSIPITSLTEIDESGVLAKYLSEINKLNLEIKNSIKNENADHVIKLNIDKRNKLKGVLDAWIADGLNSWTNDLIVVPDEFKHLTDKCIELRSKTITLLGKHLGNDVSEELKAVILLREKLEYQLTANKITSPLRLLSYQLFMVAIFDTYLNSVEQSNDEDDLYDRIISTADEFHVNDPNVEMIRMNIGNMYSRNYDYVNARNAYKTAIQNLQAMYDKSVVMTRCITYVITHMFHLDLEMGDKESLHESLMIFKEHINRLDILDASYLVDQCMYITAELCNIDIEDESSYDSVIIAEKMFEIACNKLHLNPDEYAYGDIFVYLPNMIARYYIDHKNQQDSTNYFHKAEDFINISWENCLKLTEYKYEEGLFHQGELKHQLGFLYASKPSTWENALEAYEVALRTKRRLHRLTKYPSSELGIAQTLVNYGAIELNILEKTQLFQSTKEYKLDPLHKALTALDIYKKHMREDNANSELGYYQALQLKATILDYMYKAGSNNLELDAQAKDAYMQCWNWNKINPTNEYRMRFLQYSGQALLNRGIISNEEYLEIKRICMSRNDN